MTMRKYIAGIVAGFLVLAFMAAVYFTRIVYRPVKKLTVAMQSVAEGDITTRAEVISQDEIGMAASEFNQMLDRIEELIARLIKEEQMKKDAELSYQSTGDGTTAEIYLPAVRNGEISDEESIISR